MLATLFVARGKLIMGAANAGHSHQRCHQLHTTTYAHRCYLYPLDRPLVSDCPFVALVSQMGAQLLAPRSLSRASSAPRWTVLRCRRVCLLVASCVCPSTVANTSNIFECWLKSFKCVVAVRQVGWKHHQRGSNPSLCPE